MALTEREQEYFTSLVTPNMRAKCLRLRHVLAYLTNASAYKRRYADYKPVYDSSRKFCVVVNRATRRRELRLIKQQHLHVITSMSELFLAVKEVHEKAGHGGHQKVQALFREYYYFPCATDFIARVVKECPICISKKIEAPPPPVPGSKRKSHRPNEVWVIDYTTWKKWKMLNIVDHYSRYLWGAIFKRGTAANVVKLLDQILKSPFVRLPKA